MAFEATGPSLFQSAAFTTEFGTRTPIVTSQKLITSFSDLISSAEARADDQEDLELEVVLAKTEAQDYLLRGKPSEALDSTVQKILNRAEITQNQDLLTATKDQLVVLILIYS